MDTHFLITGGTGFIGSNLCSRLLCQHPDASITLLVRAEDERQAALRLDILRKQVEISAPINNLEDRIGFVMGDVTLPYCGIGSSAREELVARTTHIVHGAANLRFDLPMDQIRKVNLEGTRRVLQIGQECQQRGQLRNFAYIGTSSVSGRREGRIYEDELEMGQQFFNTYEQSKYETEQLLHCWMEEMPVTILRPSIVIGDSRTGRTTLFNVIYYPLRFIRDGLLNFVPGAYDTLIDLVPVDWVVDAMSFIMSHDQIDGRTFHLTAGPERATKLGEFLDHAVGYFDTHCPLDEPRKVAIVDMAEFQSRVEQLTGMLASLYSKMGLLLGYAAVNRLFDTTNTDEVLRKSGLQFPRYGCYADNILRYCLLTDWGKRED